VCPPLPPSPGHLCGAGVLTSGPGRWCRAGLVVLRLVRVAIGGLPPLDPAALPAGAARPLTAAELTAAYDAAGLPGPPPAVFPRPRVLRWLWVAAAGIASKRRRWRNWSGGCGWCLRTRHRTSSIDSSCRTAENAAHRLRKITVDRAGWMRTHAQTRLAATPPPDTKAPVCAFLGGLDPTIIVHTARSQNKAKRCDGEESNIRHPDVCRV
jgi:hypothetical protein